jgi:pyruvate ferredoxin oxidoreductase gamma subunit
VTLERAVREELSTLSAEVVEQNVTKALAAFEEMAPHEACVGQQRDPQPNQRPAPRWIDLALDSTSVATPTIQRARTSQAVKTGLWRTRRPVIQPDRCGRCWWICSAYCPDGAINVERDGERERPSIDYEHCKGCLICASTCPWHAIASIPEHEADQP